MSTATLAASMAALHMAGIPEDVRQSAKHVLLDSIACIIAARDTEMAPIVAACAGMFGAEAGDAYRHARLADCMDFNEGYAGAHFGCGAVGALLAMAAHRPLDGATALAAMVAGFETGARITQAVGSYYVDGPDGRPAFAPVWGIATQVAYASVATTARALGLDAEATARAYDLAGSNSPIPIGGAWSAAVDLPNTKYCDAGWGAVTGLFAALSAEAGSTPVKGLLSGPNTLFAMLGAPNANPALAVAELGTNWHLPLVRFKSWPCCGLISGGMAALRGLVEAEGLAVIDITAITVEVVPAIALPRFANTAPNTFVSRQFSLPHAAAMLLLDVPPSAAWLSPRVAEHPAVRSLRQKIALAVYQGEEDLTTRPCAVQVQTACATYAAGPGEVAPPPSSSFDGQAVLRKFRALVEPLQGEAIIAAVMAMESLPDLRPLADAIAAARPRPSLPAALARLDALMPA
jgi:2-methylcitrate dehydratase PrpD